MKNNIQETFATALKLESCIKIYVPSTMEVNSAAADMAQRMTDSTAAALSEMFGGATITDASGAWMSDVFGLVREQVKIVYAFAMRDQLNSKAAELWQLVNSIKEQMKQEAVSVEIDGALYLV